MSLSVDIKKVFKGFVLDVQFQSSGAPLGILGASGSGKSITLKCIAGIETPDEGHIELNGRILFDAEKRINLRPQQRKIGYLFQSYALFPHMSVAENIACALDGKKADKDEKIAQLMQRFALNGLERHYPAQLSGGQQQRVALARCLAYEPQVLLLDEPFSALDTYLKEALQIEMLKLLKGYSGDAVMVTHSRDEAYKLCRDLLVLDNGGVQAMGDMYAMFQNPKSLVAARLTGCKNFSRAEKASEQTVHALDWGCTLRVRGPISAGITHIGVRAHYFTPCEESAANAIPVVERQRVESPFEWNVLFDSQGVEGANGGIWWKYAKTNPVNPHPSFLCVAPENILLLEDGSPSCTIKTENRQRVGQR